MLDNEEASIEKESVWPYVGQIITQGILALSTVVGFIFFILMFIKGVTWYADSLYPIVDAIAFYTPVFLVPPALLLAIFKPSRGLAGALLQFAAGVLLFGLWAWALVVAYASAGLIWMIIGVLFIGVGIFPVAIIGAALHQEWAMAISIIIVGVIGWGLRIGGVVLTGVPDKGERY